MNITVKKSAAEMLQKKLGDGQFLRVGISEGGCAGLTYSADIADTMEAGEVVVHEVEGIRIVTVAEREKYLDGLVIDFSDDLLNGGLKFTNSNTAGTCGCGQSFNLSGFPVAPGGSCSG